MLAWGEIAYEAYRIRASDPTFGAGLILPEWKDVPAAQQKAWEDSAKAVRQSCINLIGVEGHGGNFAAER